MGAPDRSFSRSSHSEPPHRPAAVGKVWPTAEGQVLGRDREELLFAQIPHADVTKSLILQAEQTVESMAGVASMRT